MKYKDFNVTFLRFIAIILVMFGHSIIIYDPSWGFYSTKIQSEMLCTIKHIINLIQMPLFFSISGYLFFYTINNNKNKFRIIYKKFKRLIIPFLIIGLGYFLPLKYILHNESFTSNTILYNIFHNIILGYNNGHLWFLVVLFLIFLIFTFIYKNYNKKLIDFIYILIFVFVNLLSSKITLQYIPSVLLYLIYFFIGFLANKYKSDIKKPIYYTVLYVFILIVLNMLNKDLLIIQLLNLITIIYIIFSLYNIDFTKLKKYKFIQLISDNSFGLYLFHSPLIYITFIYFSNINPILMIFINFIFWGSISLCFTLLIKKTRLKNIIGL